MKENCGSFRLHKPDNLSVSHANRHKPDNFSVSHANRQRDRRMEKVGPRSVLAVVPQVKMSIVDKIYS